MVLTTARKAFDDNRGLRIDLLLASAPLNARLIASGIDYPLRGMENLPIMPRLV